jgi:hypothetical protein
MKLGGSVHVHGMFNQPVGHTKVVLFSQDTFSQLISRPGESASNNHRTAELE